MKPALSSTKNDSLERYTVMRTKTRIIFLLAFLFVALPGSDAYPAGYAWSGSSVSVDRGWQVINSASSVEGGALVLTSGTAPRVVSPQLNIPASESVMEITLVSPADGTGALGVGTSSGALVTKYFNITPGRKVYAIYLGDAVKKGAISGFVMELYGGAGGEYRLESVRFYKPSTLELLKVLWGGFMEPETIKVSTINSITTPSFGPVSLPVMLYAFIIVFTAAASLAWPRLSGRRGGQGAYLTRAAALAFFVAAVTLALRMDYNWVKLRETESRTLSGKSEAGKVRELNGPETGSFLSFVDFVRRSVPEGKTVAPAVEPAGDQRATMARYYLLPVITSSKPDYLWVYNDASVYYDPATSSLKKGGAVVAERVRLFKAYSTLSAVYEVIKKRD